MSTEPKETPMTDKTAPNVTDKDRRLARKWAESIESATNSVESITNPWSDRALAAARVLLAVLPKRPTLADMTLDDQDECTGMQADLAQGDRVVILDGTPDHDGLVQVLEKSLDVYRAYPADVTLRPDLPRLEWPGGDEEAEDANTVKVGDVIESADDPRIDALPVGSILLDCDGETAIKRSEAWTGDGYTPIEDEGGTFGPWKVLHIPNEADQ